MDFGTSSEVTVRLQSAESDQWTSRPPLISKRIPTQAQLRLSLSRREDLCAFLEEVSPEA